MTEPINPVSWEEKRRDLDLETQGRDLLLARAIARGNWTQEERIIAAILRLLERERFEREKDSHRRHGGEAWDRP